MHGIVHVWRRWWSGGGELLGEALSRIDTRIGLFVIQSIDMLLFLSSEDGEYSSRLRKRRKWW